jgi:PilZ domain
MKPLTRRKYSRHPHQIPIMYAEYDSDDYRAAMMHNYCPEGMYFESESPIRPSSDLFIKIQRRRRRIIGAPPFKAFRARMKWCQPVPEGRVRSYGIGVQFTAKSHLMYGINIRNSNDPCDFCENAATDRLVHRSAIGLLLCLSCLDYMESLPQAAENAVERFLIGNVV